MKASKCASGKEIMHIAKSAGDMRNLSFVLQVSLKWVQWMKILEEVMKSLPIRHYHKEFLSR